MFIRCQVAQLLFAASSVDALSSSHVLSASAALGGPGKDTAKANAAGKETARKTGAGHATAIAHEAGVKTAAQQGAGILTAQTEGVGVAKAQAEAIGVKVALQQAVGKEVALQQGVGKAAAAEQGAGKATALLYSRAKCVDANPNFHDIGYPDDYRGWYDIQGCGKCEDYCRWVGQDAGSGGDPSKSLRHGQAWWSCRLAGSEYTQVYTNYTHFESFPHKRCAYRGQHVCFPPQDSEEDEGFSDDFRGWYDVQGCGTCNDYCRWVGHSGSGGDPSQRSVFDDSYWSCRLAGSDISHSVAGYFPNWNFKKCKSKGEENCKPASTSDWDEGYFDDYRGWYDLQGCGSCNDYCRWVGLDGPGGDPAKQMEKGASWWSCRLAGTSQTYTPRGHFQSWNHTLCNNGPGIRAAHANHAGQKTAVAQHAGVIEARYEQAGVEAALSHD
jgi:ferredoxin